MARRVKASDITKAHQDVMIKYLQLTPKKLSANPNVPEPRPIRCWEVRDEYVHVPLFFADKLEASHGILTDEVKGTRDCTFNFNRSLREYQEPLMVDAVKQLKEFNATTLWSHPGSGKTAMSMYLASAMSSDKPTLIVIPKVALIDSWVGTIADFTDATWYTVPDKKVDVDALMKAKVVICMDTRFHKLPPGYLNGIGVAIVDECHTFAKTQGRVLTVLSIVCDYIVLATATYVIESGMHRFLQCVAGKHYVRKEFKDPLRIVKVNTRINPTLPEAKIDLLRYRLIRHPDYNKWIIDIVKQYISTEKILILTWLTEHVEKLVEGLEAESIPVTSYFGDQKQYREDKVCVSTLAKVGFGFDEKYAAVDFSGIPFSAVILPLSIRDPAFYEQVIGRGMRSKNPLFITFIDSHFITRAHWKKNKEWIDNHAVDLKEISVT